MMMGLSVDFLAFIQLGLLSDTGTFSCTVSLLIYSLFSLFSPLETVGLPRLVF